MIELNQMITIEAKMDALMNEIGNHDRRMHSAHEVGIVVIKRRGIVLKRD